MASIVVAFYYDWYGNPAWPGAWQHWVNALYRTLSGVADQRYELLQAAATGRPYKLPLLGNDDRSGGRHGNGASRSEVGAGTGWEPSSYWRIDDPDHLRLPPLLQPASPLG